MKTEVSHSKPCQCPEIYVSSPDNLDPRLDASVESDIVGYTTIQMDAGKWYQVGNPFVELDDGVAPTVNTVFSSGFSDGDRLYIYDSATSAYTTILTWRTSNNVSGWYTRRGGLSNEELPYGHAVFISKIQSSAVTLKGKVSAEEAVVFGSDTQDTWSQICCVYPSSMSLNEMKWTGMTDGDKAYVYNPETAVYDTILTWRTIDGSAGWRTRRGGLDNTVVSPGQAIFVYKQTAPKGSCEAPVSTL